MDKKESFKEENLVGMRPFKAISDDLTGISYEEPIVFPGLKAKKIKHPDVYKRIVSDGKERWDIYLEEDNKKK